MPRLRSLMLPLAAAFLLPSLTTPGADGLPAWTLDLTRAEAAIAGKPQDYLRVALRADLFEVESSKIALERAAREEVKAFARLMVADHTKSTESLRRAAGQDSVTTPVVRLEAAQAARLKDLEEASGEQFDRLYLDLQITGHADALALHRTYAASGEGAVLKATAAEIAPMVERHLAMARRLLASFKKQT